MPRKFSNIDHLKRNRGLEGDTGVDLKIDNNIYLTVRAASDANQAWKEKAPKALREIKRQTNAGAPDAKLRALFADLYAGALVIGWRGVVDEAGDPVPFSKEACVDFLTEADDAVKAIDDYCYDTQNFRVARAESIVDEAKN